MKGPQEGITSHRGSLEILVPAYFLLAQWPRPLWAAVFSFSQFWFTVLYQFLLYSSHSDMHIYRYTHTHILFLYYFLSWPIPGDWVKFPVLYSRTLLLIHSVRFGAFSGERGCFCFVLFCFGSLPQHAKFLGQGSNPCHSSDPSHCRNTTRSLTHCFFILNVMVWIY